MKIRRQHNCCRGFTLIEVMIAVGLFGLVTAGAFSVYLMCQRIWHSTSLKMQTSREASMALSRLVYGPGAHNGLRGAAACEVIGALGAWAGGEYPPAANSPGHSISTGGSEDGSWRLVFSNSFDGVRWIDYNRAASNIVFWPDIGSPEDRELICNYVATSSASATADGVSISLTIAQHDGRFSATNHAETFVKLRNK